MSSIDNDIMRKLIFSLLSLVSLSVIAQKSSHKINDEGGPNHTNDSLPLKIMHAEPLYIDLIRDLGAHKGEKEWNLGFGLTDINTYDEYEALIEYEFAVANRLGLEFEVPVTIYSAENNQDSIDVPSNRIESLKAAIQWTFLVNKKFQSSMALGYINELEFYDLNTMGNGKVFSGNKFNPFFVGAKRLGDDFHFLVYTGPSWVQEFDHKGLESGYEAHFNFHYMIPKTNNFIGLELNNEWSGGKAHTVLRPQMRLDIVDNFRAGMVMGIPLDRSDERLSFFIRLIWEP